MCVAPECWREVWSNAIRYKALSSRLIYIRNFISYMLQITNTFDKGSTPVPYMITVTCSWGWCRLSYWSTQAYSKPDINTVNVSWHETVWPFTWLKVENLLNLMIVEFDKTFIFCKYIDSISLQINKQFTVKFHRNDLL